MNKRNTEVSFFQFFDLIQIHGKTEVTTTNNRIVWFAYLFKKGVTKQYHWTSSNGQTKNAQYPFKNDGPLPSDDQRNYSIITCLVWHRSLNQRYKIWNKYLIRLLDSLVKEIMSRI